MQDPETISRKFISSLSNQARGPAFEVYSPRHSSWWLVAIGAIIVGLGLLGIAQ